MAATPRTRRKGDDSGTRAHEGRSRAGANAKPRAATTRAASIASTGTTSTGRRRTTARAPRLLTDEQVNQVAERVAEMLREEESKRPPTAKKAPKQKAGKTPARKVNAAALGSAVATVLWVLLAAYVTTDLSKEVVATLTGATATIFAFALGYFISD